MQKQERERQKSGTGIERWELTREFPKGYL